MSTAAKPLATNKAAGLLVEDLVEGAVDALRLVPDDVAEHYDAVATSLVTPSESLPFVGLCLLERGAKVEIKSVTAFYSDGARGRFYLRPEQHEALLQAGGSYLFVVCDDDPQREILSMKIVPATLVDDVLPEWFAGGDGRSDYAQLTWTRIFGSQEVSADV